MSSLPFFSEEHPLHVARHGDEPEEGECVVEILHIVGGMDGLIESEDECERQEHAVVAEAQPYRRL